MGAQRDEGIEGRVRARESAIFFVAGGRWRAEHSPGRRPPTASESEARAGSQCTHLSQAPSLRERKGATRAVRNRNGGRRRREARWSATEKEENMGGRARGGGARGAPSNARETWSRPGRSTKWRRRTHRPPSGSSLALAVASLGGSFLSFSRSGASPTRRPLVPASVQPSRRIASPSVHNLRNLTVCHGVVSSPAALSRGFLLPASTLLLRSPPLRPSRSFAAFPPPIDHPPSHRAIFHNSKSNLKSQTIFFLV